MVELPHATRQAGRQNLVFSFTFVRVYYLTTVKWRSFFQDHLWVIWTTEAGIKTFLWFLACALRLLLSQWYSCLAQFHLRGRGWTNFSPLFMTGMIQDHHLHALQDLESLGTSMSGICYVIAKQYWAAWGLSESVVFHVVSWVPFWVVLVWFWLGCFLLFVCLCCFEDTYLFAFTYSPTCGNSQSKTKRFDDRLSLERARHELKKKNCRRNTFKTSSALPLQG